MAFDEFLALMDILLGESGCPWDKAQTYESLRADLLEECYETIDAVDKNDIAALKEELGDVLLLVIFYCKIAQKNNAFTISDVITHVGQKLISRHTHIFGADTAQNEDEALIFWEKSKEREREGKSVKTILDAVPKALPALVRAEKVLKRSKAAETDISKLICEIKNNLSNLENENDKALLFQKFGSSMLQMVNLSGILEINAEFSLTNSTEEFINTFSK